MSQSPSDTPPPNLTIRARPRAVRRFSRKALIGGSIGLGTIMFAALAVALQSPDYGEAKSDELYNVTHKPMAEGLELLPKSYGEMKPKLGPPLPGDLGAAYMSANLEPVIAEPTALPTKPKPQKLASYSRPRSASWLNCFD